MSGLVYHIALLNGVWSSGDLLIWPAAIRQGAFSRVSFFIVQGRGAQELSIFYVSCKWAHINDPHL